MSPNLRVERAIRLLPSVEAMEPLRELLLSTSSADDANRWSGSGQYLTLGKRGIDIEGLRERATSLLPRIAAHLALIYKAYIDALAASHHGDFAAAAAALIEGGAAEEGARRLADARAWYESAFRVAAELQEREPEIEILDRLGRVSTALGRFNDAARYYQRAYVLAEAGFAHEAAIRACLGLGKSAEALDQLAGANAWYLRGLRMAESGDHPSWRGQLQRELGLTAWRQGDASAARDHLQRARDELEPLGQFAELARTLCTIARVEHSLGRTEVAMAALREALAWARREPADQLLLVDALMDLAELYSASGQLLDAEQELRRAEQAAIVGKFTDRLVQVYRALGRLSGVKRDETGFVFFEQAIELCHTLPAGSALEGRLYEDYGNFRLLFGDREEARAHLERARQLFQAAGDGASLDRLRMEIAMLSA